MRWDRNKIISDKNKATYRHKVLKTLASHALYTTFKTLLDNNAFLNVSQIFNLTKIDIQISYRSFDIAKPY